MIISIERLKTFITTDESDAVLEAKLQALELLIRKYTNNNFQVRAVRARGECFSNSKIIKLDSHLPLRTNDTIQISESSLMPDMLCTVVAYVDGIITTDVNIFDESVLITKVAYPMDVQLGVVNMLKWDVENREKVGIQSESISRHSVTYFNMDGDNSNIGYPKSLTGFLKPYMKARF